MNQANKYSQVESLIIKPTAPFNFDTTFHKPDHFTSGDNLWQPGIRWQTWFWQEKELGLKFVDKSTKKKPKIKTQIFYNHELSPKILNSLKAEIIYRYNLDLNLNDFYINFLSDPILSPAIKNFHGMRPGHQSSLYEYLIIGIVLQNTIIKRSIQMMQSLYENFGKLIEFDEKKLWCFWKPGGLINVSEQNLRDLKLGYRAKFIKRIDDQLKDGSIDELALRKQDFQTQKSKLLELFGVGPATVWYLLFDVFHHYDFFEHISPWEQKIYTKLFFDKDPEPPLPIEKLLKYFEKYGKYRQLAVHYIWEDIWWKRKNQNVPWLEKLVRI